MNPMRGLGPVLWLLKIRRFRDWYRFTWAKLRTPGTVIAAGIPKIDPPFRLRMSPDSVLVIGEQVRLSSGMSLQLHGAARVEIGDRTFFNVHCTIGAADRVLVGADCLFAPGVTIVDSNHRFDDVNTPIREQGLNVRCVEIGNDVWVGSHATVISNIGSGSVVGANSVVTRNLPEFSVAVGAPATVIRRRGERRGEPLSRLVC